MSHVLLADASLWQVLDWLWDGFKAIPVAIWHLLPGNIKTLHNIIFIIGMILFVGVYTLIVRRPRRRVWVRRRMRA